MQRTFIGVGLNRLRLAVCDAYADAVAPVVVINGINRSAALVELTEVGNPSGHFWSIATYTFPTTSTVTILFKGDNWTYHWDGEESHRGYISDLEVFGV